MCVNRMTGRKFVSQNFAYKAKDLFTLIHSSRICTFTRKYFLHTTGLIATLAMAGCTSMAPHYERPEVTLPTTYKHSAPSNLGTNVTDLSWRSYFKDPTLIQLVDQALANNLDLRSAVLKVQEAQIAYGIQRSTRLPTIGADLEALRGRTPSDLSPSGQAITNSQFQAGVGINSWEIDFWGRIASLNEAALQNFLATDAARRAIQITIIAQVADTYLALLEANERLQLAQASEANQRESLRIFKRRREVGSASQLELTQVETLLTQAESLVVQIEQERDAQRVILGILVGDISNSATTIEEHNPLSINMLSTVDSGLPSELLYSRPDIVAAEHKLQSANANIGAARAAFFPRISLTAFGGTISAELDHLFRGTNQSWSFMPSITMPIFDSGRNRANLNLAEIRKEIVVVEYEQAVQNAFRDVADALSAQHWSLKQVEVKRRALKTQQERVRLSHLSYDNGASSFLEVLDAERNLIFAEQELAQTQRILLSSRISLYAALGGGSGHINGSYMQSDSPSNTPVID